MFLLSFLVHAALSAPPLPDLPSDDAVERVLAGELERALPTLQGAPDPAYYVALAAEDQRVVVLSATAGALSVSDSRVGRTLDVDVRVGSPQLDSTHPLRGMSALREDGRSLVQVPFGVGDDFSLRHAIWQTLDARFREAAERIVVLRANQAVKVEEETLAPDFEQRTGVQDRRAVEPHPLDIPAWERTLVRASLVLDASPMIHASQASMRLVRQRTTLVDTEGTRLTHGGNWGTVDLSASATAPDGDVIDVRKVITWRDPAHVPVEGVVLESAQALVDRLGRMLAAPWGEPFSGPVILRGKASAVFFHEVMGHRVEGHRQKRDDEGKTFLEYIGRPILPPFLDVVDDPTLERLAGTDLFGHYAYDDEGVAAQRVPLVEKGIFKGFLMGRSPLPAFPTSNGHGRRSSGNAPTSRMGNTLIQARSSVPYAELRRMLIEEIKAQKLPYGMIVDDIEGGFTMTGRYMPNAFNVRATTTWRVYPDGRPDQLVRGLDLVGTPLVAFSSVLAAADDTEVFNGWCGAESGSIPVAAASPSLLVRKLEFQLKEKGEDRPPLMDKPADAPAGNDGRGA